LKRYEEGEVTAEERAQVDRWLDSRGSREGVFAEADRKFMEQALLSRIKDATGQREGFLAGGWWKIAASMLMVLAAGYGVWRYVAPAPVAGQLAISSVTAGGAIEKLLLSDGTLVWLKPGGKLIYPAQFDGDTRQVTLEGEALFEVQKDPAHPFVIRCGDIVTRVLGTSFNIRSTAERTEVFVLTGKVSVTLERTQENVQLLPSERAVYAHDTRKLEKIEPQPGQQAEVYTQGTEYAMSLENITMREVADRIAHKFDVDVTLSGPIADCLITADLTDQSLENTLDILTETRRATYTLDAGKVVLTGTGCR
jgi:ferric-dicitrate binding protein FerR (iron transport regulator)